MRSETEVLVIGAGVVGVCAAYYLAQAGRQVVVVEKGEVCSGSSYGNAGLIVPSHCVPLAEPGVMRKGLRWMLDPSSPFCIRPRLDRQLISWLWRFRGACNADHVRRSMPLLRDLQLESLRLFGELALRPDMGDFGYRQRGALYVARTDAGFESVSAEARLVLDNGLEVEILDGEQVRELEPGSRLEVTGGAYYPQNAHVQPDRFVRSLAQSAQRRGAVIYAKTEVLEMEVSGERIRAVETTRGRIEADEVVLAAGAWSPALARDLRLELPIQAAKGYSVTFDKPKRCPRIPLMLTEAKVAVTPMGDLLRFAGTLELAGMDLSVNMRRVRAMLAAVPAYLPELDPQNLSTAEVWRGLRPCTPDGLPFLGRSAKYANLVVAAGHATVGLSLGPVSGSVVSRLVCGEDPGFDLRPLSPERYC